LPLIRFPNKPAQLRYVDVGRARGRKALFGEAQVNIWTLWLNAIDSLLAVLAAHIGLGLAIVVGTIVLRILLLPLTWTVFLRNFERQKKLIALQQELASIKERYRDKPDEQARRTLDLYRSHGVAFFDGKGILVALAQMPMFVGMYQVLRDIRANTRFIWIADLAKPDTVLATVAGVTTMLMIMLNPDLPDSIRLIVIVIPTILAFLAALKFSSALAIYWTTTNCLSTLQTMAMRAIVARAESRRRPPA
jgi:YidC/Oxa1 family membrane protein insertase